MKNIICAGAAFLTFMMASLVSAQGVELAPLLKKTEGAEVYNRIITITPNTKWVNVHNGERVKFVDTGSGQSFIWNVDTFEYRLDLATVAPDRVLNGRRVLAYIRPKCDCHGMND